MKAAKAPKPTSSRVPQNGIDKSGASGKRGFRRRIQFRQAAAGGAGGRGGGGGGVGPEVMARAVALDNAQVALESFYASFPVVPLLSVAHAKVIEISKLLLLLLSLAVEVEVVVVLLLLLLLLLLLRLAHMMLPLSCALKPCRVWLSGFELSMPYVLCSYSSAGKRRTVNLANTPVVHRLPDRERLQGSSSIRPYLTGCGFRGSVCVFILRCPQVLPTFFHPLLCTSCPALVV